MPKYICQITGNVSEQKSHHDSHLRSAKYKQAVKIFELELEKLSDEKRMEKHGKTDISEIVKECSTVIEKPKEVAFEKKTLSGEVSWSLSSQEDANPEYASTKSKLESVIKRCHQILYSASSTVGSKAQNDIMRLLCLKLLSSQFADQYSGIWEKCDSVKAKYNMSDTKLEQYKNYCIHFKSLASEENITNVWKQLVTKFLMPLFPSIYFEEDSKFNTPDVNAIKDLILAIDELNVDEKFIDSFSTTCGDIHEAFRAYGGRSSGAKELGQYFTPRHLIHLMFHGLGLDALLDNDQSATIYDPCMGTGGFLTRLFKMASIPSNNIYGCETEQDTIKFGEMSMLLTTGDVDNHIKKCNSISENEFISHGKRFSAVVTNPPFGTSMKYDQLKKTYETRFPNSDVNFTEVYPLKMNNGAGLFIQHCVHMLADEGVCAIVLPDGELFEGTSGWSKKLRKWLSEQVNIRTILKVPSGTFEHAGVKTNVVVFTKDGPTQNIRFIETTKECDTVKEMFTISSEELKTSGYSLDVGEYLVEETDNYDVPMISLGEVITKQNNFQDINADIDYKIVKMSKLVAPEIREIKKGCNIKSTKLQLVEENTFIMSKILNYCYGIYNNNIQNGYLSSEYWIFKIRDNTLFNYFMLIYKNIIVHKLKSIAHGVGVPRINYQDFMSKIKIPLPSLEVQQQIVDELSQIETSIETIESRITQFKREKDQYKKYGRKAEIRELLKDSEEKTIKDLYNINYGNRSPTNTEEEEIYPSISGGSKISKYTNEWNILENTILIARSGSCGSVNMFETKCLMGSYGFFLEKKIETVNTQFNYYYLKEYQSSIENLARGTAVKNLNRDKLYDFKIPIPSQEIQQQCITLFEEKEKFIQSIDEKINSEKAYIEELRQMAKDVISSFC